MTSTTAPEVRAHVDLDAFFASVEQVDHPELRGKPVVVGALPGHRGVVSACSYEARRYGVRSAMPISQAYRLCPDAVFLPVRIHRYIELSDAVMDILRELTPVFQQISVDEAALDLTGTERLLGEPVTLATAAKRRVREATGLTLSVGIGPNRYLAKLASERSKPDGLLRVLPEEAAGFVEGIPLGKLWGVGEKTLERLHEIGITTVAELRAAPDGRLFGHLGHGCGTFLRRVSLGQDPGIHPVQPSSHSISGESTFEHDTSDSEVIRLLVLALSQEIAGRMVREKVVSSTVTLKLRLEDFTTFTARKTLARVVASGDEIASVAGDLLRRKWDGKTPVRLVGVGLGDVKPRDEWVQGELLDDRRDRARKVEEVVEKLKSRHEDLPITRASLLERKRRR